jgi:RimJ/RimL family protein N-acetyltransferase
MYDDLETERLTLRRFTNDDVEKLVELDSDPEVTHFTSNGAPTSRDKVVQRILPRMVPDGPDEGYGFWAVTERDSGEFIGWFHPIPKANGDADEPELGYRFRRRAWGQGYATEGSRALIDLAFSRLGARQVVAETMAVHTASRRVMEKAGMRHLRTFKTEWPVTIPGDELGDVEYAVTREEWEAQRRAAAPG